MPKLFFNVLFLSSVIVWPQLSNAAVSYTDGFGVMPNVYISNEDALVHIDHDGDQITGSVWLGNEWSDPENIFVDADGDFELAGNPDYHFQELRSNALVIQDDEKVITYSNSYGFQYMDVSDYEDVVINQYNNQLLLIQCGAAVAVTPWTEAAGLGDEVTLEGAACAEDLSWFIAQRDALIDYYTGSAYDVGNNFALIDSIDLTGIGYNDDFDAQGITPSMLTKKNGDIVFGFTSEDDYSNDSGNVFDDGYGSDIEYLWGYSTVTDSWQSLVNPGNSNITRGQLFQTPNSRQVFAIGSSEDSKMWRIYRWDSNTGWQLEATYDFDEAATFIQPMVSKKKKAFDWAFWFNSSDTAKFYRWKQADGYQKLTERSLECNDSCDYTMTVSKKGKVFLGWQDNPTLQGSVWVPATDSWEDKTLVETGSGQLTDVHVTSKGQFILQYFTGNTNRLRRWTPDGGWGSESTITNGIYFDGNKLYLTDHTPSTDQLTVSHWQWSSNSSVAVETLADISKFEEDNSFIYDHLIFLSILTGDDERTVVDVELD